MMWVYFIIGGALAFLSAQIAETRPVTALVYFIGGLLNFFLFATYAFR